MIPVYDMYGHIRIFFGKLCNRKTKFLAAIAFKIADVKLCIVFVRDADSLITQPFKILNQYEAFILKMFTRRCQ